jgi:hypothetical protein
MSITYSITPVGFEPLISGLREVVTRSADLREMRDPLRGEYVRANRENLLSEGTLVGGWAPLSERTKAEKRRKGYGGRRIEERTGRLFSAMTDPASAYFFEDVKRDEATFGPDLFYAETQHKGDESKNLPARQLRPEPNVGRYAEIVRSHAAEVGRLSGFTVV